MDGRPIVTSRLISSARSSTAKFWTLSGQRISYMRDKTKDERYWILTLFAIAKELEKSGNTSPMVEADLAVGLPPEHYALRQRFADYFKRGRVNFVFNGAPICLLIRHVFVYPQAYAAVVPQAGRLKEIPRTFIIDIGGYPVCSQCEGPAL